MAKMSLYESIVNRVRGQQTIDVEEDVSEAINSSMTTELVQFLQDIRNNAKSRNDLIKEYDSMAFDSVVGSAIELIADDATQVDKTNNRVVWIEAKNKKEEKELNEFLKVIRMDDMVWSIAYNVIKYGECYLKTYYSECEPDSSVFKDDKILATKLGFLFEIVNDISTVSDLQMYGDTVGYAFTDERDKSIIYGTKDYIHFINDRGVHREEVSIEMNELDDNGKKKKQKFTVRFGTSFIEAARESFKILNLLENVLISVRFGRSALYRIFNIEVGGASRAETSKILREFKSKLSQTEQFNVKEGIYNSGNKPLPYGSNIYVSTRNNKGTTTIDTVGGDVDIKDIVDIEYYRNKLFAALKVPKAYLGSEEMMPGGIGNQSLTRMDIRYARTVKRCIKVIQQGVEDMIHFYGEVNGKDFGEFSVEMMTILSAEDTDYKDEFANDIQTAEAFKGLLTDSGIDVEQMIKIILDDILHMDKDTMDKLYPDKERIPDAVGSTETPPPGAATKLVTKGGSSNAK